MKNERELYWGGTGALKSCNYVTPNVHYDFVFTSNTYNGIMMSNIKRLVEKESDIIENLENEMKTLNYGGPFQLFKTYQKDYPEVLQTRVLMTQFITNDFKTLGAIWFDDGTQDIKESLYEVYNKLDWTKARDFDY
jgi:hypothetical protein